MANSLNIKFPLQKGTKGAFETNNTTLDAITSDLKILLLTNYGERPCQYDFGANLRGLIFEVEGDQLTTAIKDRIQAAIDKWMPFVLIKDITVETSATNLNIKTNEMKLTIEFGVGNIDTTQTLVQTIKS